MLYGSPLPRVVAMTRIGEGSENENFFFFFFRESRVSSNFFLCIFFFLAVGDWTFFYLENKAENVVCKKLLVAFEYSSASFLFVIMLRAIILWRR